MKKFTLLVTAALMALAMTAAPVQQKQMRIGKQQKAFMELPSAKLTKAAAAHALKSPKLVKAASDNEIIWDQPEGELKYYMQFGRGWQLYDWSYMFEYEQEGAGEIVYADNNEVYLKYGISSFKEMGWVKGSLSEDGKKITVKYPQHVFDVEGYDASGKLITASVLVSMMAYTDAEGYDDFVPVDEAENVVTYTVNEDGSVSMDGSKDFDTVIDPDTGYETVVLPEKMLTCYYTYTDSKTLETFQIWFGYGDIAQSFNPLPSDLIINEYPEGLKFEMWALTDAVGKAQPVDVAFDGDYVYLKNLDEYNANCIVKGKLEGNKVTFPSKQFFGICDDGYDFVFFFGCTYGTYYDPDYESEVEGFIMADKLEMTYDKDTKTLTAPESTGYVVNASPTKIWYYSSALEPVITYQDPESLNAAPNDPEFVEYFYAEEYEQDWFCWVLPNTNVNGSFIDTNMMYYNMYANGELYTLSPDVYPYVPEPVTNIPFGYSDLYNYDIIVEDATGRQYFITYDGLETFGLVMYYLAPDGNLYNSQRVTYNIATGEVTKDEASIDTPSYAEPVSISFYNLQGMKIANPAAGNIYIRSVTFKDGTKQATKFIAK
ncbi:MAG: hypothetical protein HUK14_03345 [Muribaculaceae bacterium]|mgnify:FL=1|nr:hypothetical protein [Muribaculaceae bacterium]